MFLRDAPPGPEHQPIPDPVATPRAEIHVHVAPGIRDPVVGDFAVVEIHVRPRARNRFQTERSLRAAVLRRPFVPFLLTIAS